MTIRACGPTIKAHPRRVLTHWFDLNSQQTPRRRVNIHYAVLIIGHDHPNIHALNHRLARYRREIEGSEAKQSPRKERAGDQTADNRFIQPGGQPDSQESQRHPQPLVSINSTAMTGISIKSDQARRVRLLMPA